MYSKKHGGESIIGLPMKEAAEALQEDGTREMRATRCTNSV